MQMHYLVTTGRYIFPVLIVMVVLSGFRTATFSVEHLQAGAPPIANTLLIAWITGGLLGPLLLPWLPGHTPGIKGVLAGLLGLLLFPAFCLPLHLEPLDVLMAILVIPSVTKLLISGSPAGKAAFTLGPPSMGQRIIFSVHVAMVAVAAGIWIRARFT